MSENDSIPQDQEENMAEEDLDIETEGDEPETIVKPDPVEKPKESPEDKVARLKRQLSREEKKLGIVKEEPKAKSGDLDYGQLAYLTAKEIESEKEVALVKEWMKNTGKELKDVVTSKYFQNELKDLRESEASAAAVPKGTKRSAPASNDTVDYWLNKGELPPVEKIKLRRDVLNARISREKEGDKFSPNPIIQS